MTLSHERIETFWSRVERGTDCWPWKASVGVGGYGRFSAGGKWRRAHRIAYEIAIGPIPEGLVLDHLCRNRICVNPAHLEPVTQVENLRRGNRSGPKKGSPPNRCKLTVAQVAAIKSDPRPLAILSAEYGVGRSAIGRIRQGLRWANVQPLIRVEGQL